MAEIFAGKANKVTINGQTIVDLSGTSLNAAEVGKNDSFYNS
jgi:hypothetical protein